MILEPLTLKGGNLCPWCGESHPGYKCPLIKSIVYFRTGEIREYEFFPAIDDTGLRLTADADP